MRIFSIYSSDKEGERVAHEFVQNLKCNYASPDIIAEALQCIVMCKCKFGKFRRPDCPTMWLVLPYHSLLLKSFKVAIHNCHNSRVKLLWKIAFQGSDIKPPNVNIAWSAANKKIEQWIRF